MDIDGWWSWFMMLKNGEEEVFLFHVLQSWIKNSLISSTVPAWPISPTISPTIVHTHHPTCRYIYVYTYIILYRYTMNTICTHIIPPYKYNAAMYIVHIYIYSHPFWISCSYIFYMYNFIYIKWYLTHVLQLGSSWRPCHGVICCYRGRTGASEGRSFRWSV